MALRRPLIPQLSGRLGVGQSRLTHHLLRTSLFFHKNGEVDLYRPLNDLDSSIGFNRHDLQRVGIESWAHNRKNLGSNPGPGELTRL